MAPLICSLYIVSQAHIDGVNKWTLTRMLKNIFIDSLGGAIPFLGDIFDVLFKANTKNMALWKSNISTTPSSSIQYKDKFYIIAAISVVFAIGIGISILVIMLFLNLLKAIN